MKISKLFHWLYAFLMALPVFALLPSLFYFAFNQKSENYTLQSVTETYEYETNEVNSVNDLVVGNIYQIDNPQDYIDSGLDINVSYLKLETTDSMVDIKINYVLNAEYIEIYRDTSNLSFYICNYYIDLEFNVNYQDIVKCYFVFQRLNDNGDWYEHPIKASDYLGEKSVTITESEQSPTNIFYTAVDKVFETPLFEWSKTSLLVTPFQYISGLFGMPSNSPITYYLSYWLAISIVYLVFDLVIYVPLLVHRWIDKGVVE